VNRPERPKKAASGCFVAVNSPQDPTLRCTSIRFFAGLLVSLGLVFAALAEEAPATIEQANARLDRARATLDDVAHRLAEPQQSSASLKLLRERVAPLPADLGAIADGLAPRIAAIEARLKELAPQDAGADKAKDDKAGDARPNPPPTAPVAAPPAAGKAPAPQKPADSKAAAAASAATAAASAASAATTRVEAERTEQQKLFDEADAIAKRARALAREAAQLQVDIVARQRDLFAKTVFLQSAGLFSPGLWRDAALDAPPAAAAARTFLADRFDNVARRLDDGTGATFLLLSAMILLAIPPALLLARRVLARGAAKTPPTPFRKAAGAGWTALVAAAVPIAAVGAFGLLLDSFNLVDATLEPVLRRLFEGVARTAIAYALARAIFAPIAPDWRSIDPGDALTARFVTLAALAAGVLSLSRVVEQIEETVQAALPVVVATRGTASLAVAAIIAAAAAPERHGAVAVVEKAEAPRRDWLTLARGLGALLVVVIVVACAAGYVTFANFFIVEAGWVAGVAALLFILQGIAAEGIAAAFAPKGLLGRPLGGALGLRDEQLAQIAVLLSGAATLVVVWSAIVLAAAPLGVQSGDLLAAVRSAFFSLKVGDVTISPATGVGAVLIFAVTLGVVQGLRRWLDRRYLPLTRLDAGLRNSIGATLGYAGFLAATGLALSHLGLAFEKLALVAGALSVGVGLGLQNVVGNFVSGLVILWERAIRVGDWVVVGDEQGYVKRINVRSTEIETFDRATMIVPNSNLVAGVVKNWLRGDKVGRIKLTLSPHSGVDPEAMRDILLAAARAQDGVLRIPAPQVMFLGMEASSFRFELWCYVEDVEKSTRVRSDLHFDLHKRLREAGIRLAPDPAPPAPTIVQLSGLEKLAALGALGSFAMTTPSGGNDASEETASAEPEKKPEHEEA